MLFRGDTPLGERGEHCWAQCGIMARKGAIDLSEAFYDIEIVC